MQPKIAKAVHCNLRRSGRGVQVEFVKERLSFTGEDTLAAKLLLNVMGAVAELERAMLKERQREGIAVRRKQASTKAVSHH
jgi:DNA invertase Pin-like site-specific DNA recombinase